MTALLAQAAPQFNDRNQQFLDGLREYVSTSYDPTSAMIFWSLIAAFFIAVAVVARHFTRRDTQVEKPRVDYLVLAIDLLGLTEDDRRDLQGVAREAGVREPAALLLSPRALAQAISTAPADRNRAARLDDLCRRLFGEPLPPLI